MKSSKKEMKKRLLALLLCITMVMNGGISTFAEGSEQSGHTHTEACYTNVETKELVCKVPEEEAHMHGPSCYTENKQLTCAIEASEGHVHTEECVGVISEEVTGNTCGLEESEGHTHGDECYTVSSELTCKVPETEGHKHVDECYHVIPAGTLVCTLAETADETQKGAPSDICKCGNPECTCETCEEGCTCETAEKEAKDTEVEDKKTEETENKEETKQPEKTEYSVEGGKTTPKVSITLADAAHIPDEAVLEVDSVTLTDEEAAAIEGAAKAEGIYSENITALDICFELEVVNEETGETTIENPQPLDGNEVNVAVALPGIEADDEVSVYHLRYETVTDENGEEKEVLKVEDMDASVNAETGAVEFKTPHFSTYVFVENADTAVAAIMEMLEDLPTVETVESELLAYAEAEDWDGYKEYYVEIGTAGKTAHEAYAALTEEEKANIENLEKLTALETIWSAEDLESAAEVAVVIAMIDQLPTYDEVAETLTKLEEEEDWEGYEKYIKALAKKAWPAYYAYEALSEEQKALVTNYERLMETSGVWSIMTLEEKLLYCGEGSQLWALNKKVTEFNDGIVNVGQLLPSAYGANGLTIGAKDADGVEVSPWMLEHCETRYDESWNVVGETELNKTQVTTEDPQIAKYSPGASMIVSDPKKTSEENKAFREELLENYYVIYKNIGTYQGEEVDLKIKLVDFQVHDSSKRAAFGLGTNRSSSGKYAAPAVRVSNLDWVELQNTFLNSETGEPLEVKGNVSFYDVDWNQAVYLKDNCKGIYVQDDCELKIGQVDESGYGLYDRDYANYKNEYGTKYSFTETFEGESITRVFSFTRNKNELPSGGILYGGRPIIVDGILYVKKLVQTAKKQETDTDVEYDFKIEFSDTTMTGTYGDISVTNGVGTFKLKHGEAKQISNLPVGVTYTVTETDSKGSLLTTVNGVVSNSASGTIQSPENTALIPTLEFVNTVHGAECTEHESAMPKLHESLVKTDSKEPSIKVNKTVSATDDPNEFELMLEAYVTGEAVTVPMDILLVLDRSGSMIQSHYYLSVDQKDLVPGYIYFDHDYYNETKLDGTPNPDYQKNYGLQKDTKGNVGYPSPIRWCETCKQWIKDVRNQTTNETIRYEVVDPETTRFFETNMQATERSVRQFINAIIDHGNETGTMHRVAFVDYAGSSGYLYNGGERNTTLSKARYQNAYVNVSNRESINAVLSTYAEIAYTNELYSSNTPTHKGMEYAYKVIKNKPTNGQESISRQDMVVVFADGAPGSGKNLYGYELNTKDWVTPAVGHSDSIKKMNIPIYTIGFYEGASSDSLDNDINENTYSVGNGDLYYERSNVFFTSIASDGGFIPARGASALSEAFNTIADKFSTQTLEYDAATVMREEVSKYFVFDCECTGTHTCGLTVQTADCIGKDGNGEFVFDEPVIATGITVGTAKTDKAPSTDVINITGFSYKDNAVMEMKNSSETTFTGKKLILTVPIETRHGFWGGNNVPTNDESTALYHPKDGVTNYSPTEAGISKLMEIVKFPMPEANVPMTINIEAQDKTIYYAGAVTAKDLIKSIKAGYSESVEDGETWCAPLTEVRIDANNKLVPQSEWMDDYANITWTKESTLLTTSINNRECAPYTYSVGMAVKKGCKGDQNLSENPSNIAGTPAILNTEISNVSDTGNVHILVPVLTFQDTEVPFGYEATKAEYDENNKIPEVTWVHKKEINDLVTAGTLNTLDETMLTNLAADTLFDGDVEVDVTTKPTLLIDTYSPYQPIYKDTPVDVTALSYEDRADVTSEELMNVATFMWKNCTSDLHNEDLIVTHKAANGYEFWLHTNEPYELPSTGGIGTYWYTIGGVVLMMGTSLLTYKKKREEVLGSR